jgi:phospholipid/cholesterol/gamma-HCH transport system substrate-binding protein
MSRLGRLLVSAAVLVVLVGGTVTLIRDSNGDFSGDYALSGLFTKAGEGLPPGSEVVFRGVQIGRVSSAALQGDEAKVTVLVDPSFEVPRDATATIEPVNLFGADEVSLTTPGHDADEGPYLAHGASFVHTANSDELGDLFAAATPLLQKIDTNSLSTVLGELGQASQGEGPSIARSITAGTRLAGELNATLSAQEVALDSLARFSQAVAPLGANLNTVASEVNAALPAFNTEEGDYERFLNSVIPFANDLASLLTTYRPDIDTILTAGDNVSRVLLTQQSNIGQVIQGAYGYFRTIADGAASAQRLPDGSTYAYFTTFLLFSDVNSLVCGLLAPASPGLAFLQPVQQALTGAGSAFDCTAQLAAFDAAQSTDPAGGLAAPSTGASAAPSAGTVTPGTPTPAEAAQSAANQAYGMAGEPDTSTGSGLGGFIDGLLGAGL